MNTILCAKRGLQITHCKNHVHPHWEIIFHLLGTATARIDNQEYTLSPGTITVIPPNTPHYNFSNAQYTDMYLQAKELDFCEVVVVQDIDNNVLTLMNMLHKTLTEKEFQYLEIADNLTRTISSYIKKLSNTGSPLNFVNDFKNLIYENISNPDFILSDEIKKTGYNPDYLRRCFKKTLGLPPLEYLTLLRMEHAKLLLTQHSFTGISNIAHACGFHDSYYFSTCFKKHTGVSPLRYRKSKINQ